MTCHSQLYRDAPMLAPLRRAWTDADAPLAWQRVHDLPDFVYFDHSVHVAGGVGCSSCHGRVDRMPLTWRSASLKIGALQQRFPRLRHHVWQAWPRDHVRAGARRAPLP
ncbi:MAG TPA: cytochrome c3 family protein [Solimonas sp.]|nr:cytochrome c3 family protein [Solimonas sp.]